MRVPTTYLQAATLGIAAGMRTMSAPTLISRAADSGSLSLAGSKSGVLASRAILPVTSLLAMGEVIADKLPFTPARTGTGPLTARILSGALCGAVLCGGRKRSRLLGGLLGALGAYGAAHAAYRARKAITQRTGVSDRVVALAEDAIVAGLTLSLSSAVQNQGRRPA
jgi:uncharacterized membrane protein